MLWISFRNAIISAIRQKRYAIKLLYSYGIAAGFIFFTIVKVVKGKGKEVSTILWIVDALFILNFIIMAIL